MTFIWDSIVPAPKSGTLAHFVLQSVAKKAARTGTKASLK